MGAGTEGLGAGRTPDHDDKVVALLVRLVRLASRQMRVERGGERDGRPSVRICARFCGCEARAALDYHPYRGLLP